LISQSRGLGDVYKRQLLSSAQPVVFIPCKLNAEKHTFNRIDRSLEHERRLSATSTNFARHDPWTSRESNSGA
jgi:hypothetical protein